MDVKILSNIDINNYPNRGSKPLSDESKLVRGLNLGQAAVFPKDKYTVLQIGGYTTGANEHFKQSRKFSYRSGDDHYVIFRTK